MKSIVLVLVFLVGGVASMDASASRSGHHRIDHLPKGHHAVKHGNKSYFFNAGRWYRHDGRAYISIAAPIGARVSVLPPGHITFGIGLNRYFYFSGTYYRQIPTGYEVTEKPAEAEKVLSTAGSDKLIVYPAGGQPEELVKRDRYECHAWAAKETGYDPSSLDADPAYRSDYHRGLRACLAARNYVVN